MDGDDVKLGVFVLGVILIVLGLVIAIAGGISAGLMTVGVGCILSGLGGSAYFEVRYTVMSGASGGVLFLAGAFFDYLSHLLGR